MDGFGSRWVLYLREVKFPFLTMVGFISAFSIVSVVSNRAALTTWHPDNFNMKTMAILSMAIYGACTIYSAIRWFMGKRVTTKPLIIIDMILCLLCTGLGAAALVLYDNGGRCPNLTGGDVDSSNAKNCHLWYVAHIVAITAGAWGFLVSGKNLRESGRLHVARTIGNRQWGY